MVSDRNDTVSWPLFIGRFFFCAFGSPLTFFLYLLWPAKGSFGVGNLTFLTLPVFSKGSTNDYALNLLPFAIYALLLASILICVQFIILRKFRDVGSSDAEKIKFSTPYVILCGLGYLNPFFWVEGMESNILSMFFVLPGLFVAFLVFLHELFVCFPRKR